MWATSVPSLVFLGLYVLELGPMYATDRQKSDRQIDRRQKKASLNAPLIRGGGIIIYNKHSIRRKVDVKSLSYRTW